MSVAGTACVVGVDFGTLSGRALVVRGSTGEELASAVHEYGHGVIDTTLPCSGERLPSSWALQEPNDWLEVLATAVPAAVAAAGIDPADIVGIATAFTASTPLPALRDGTPLCRLEAFEREPHAYPKLWRHHAAQDQADRITALAATRNEPWLARYGGRISSEWEFAKALQVLEEAPDIYAATDRWIEAADWIVWQLCGAETRNACTAGYKGMFQDGRYPSAGYLRELHHEFAGFVEEKLEHPLAQLGGRAGSLTAQAAGWTGLREGIAVAVGNVDAHVTAPAAQAIAPGHMLAVMGTSTCHVMNSDRLSEVPGMCGVVAGGITPGLLGYEAGQSGVGDIFGWFVDQQVPAAYAAEAERRGLDVHQYLAELAGAQAVGQHGLIGLDWHSGNRSVLVDHELSGVLVGTTLSTRPEDIYRALIEATAFGTRTIIDSFERRDVPVHELTVAGGLLKNPLLMQIYSDVLRRPLHVIESEEGPALGAAMHAAVAAGIHPDIRAASAVMGSVRRDAYRPNEADADAYDELYAHYSVLHDYFGRGALMHELRRPSRAKRRDSRKSITDLRRLVCTLHAELPRHGLVAWTSGNLSARIPGEELMVIKASGVDFDAMTPESIVVCDLFGELVEGSLSPSSDAATHGYIYRNMPEVGGVAHTHSAYATAFAARGEPIPCVLTAMADEFGGEIPIGPFARIGDEQIGCGIVETLRGHRSPAVLMQSHGVFTLGATPRDAIKAAVMCEDVARTVHLALALGGQLSSLDGEDVDALHDRYQTVYGQR